MPNLPIHLPVSTKHLDNNQSSFGLSKAVRLLLAKDFKSVFDNPIKKIHTEHLIIILAYNEFSYPRLGLAITKKKLKNAVDRNRLKRVSREVFRLNQHQITNLDMVLVVKKTYVKQHDIKNEVDFAFHKIMTMYQKIH